MSILNIVALDKGDLDINVQDISFERSSKITIPSFNTESIGSLGPVIELRDRVAQRGKVCRQDALDMFVLRGQHQHIKNHLVQYSPAMYTEVPSNINHKETMLSLESAVSKGIMDTLSTMSKYISSRATSAMEYFTDIFDDEVNANKNALRVMIMVEYSKSVTELIKKSKEGNGLDRAAKDLLNQAIETMGKEYNGLKALINDDKADLQTLIDGISGPVVTYYPDVLKSVVLLLEGLEKAKSADDIRSLMKSIKVPVIAYGKLTEWLKKKQPGVKFTPIEGGTPFQAVGTHTRDMVKKLSNDRQVRFKSRPDTFLKDSDYIPLMTSQVATEKSLAKSKDVTSKHSSDLLRLGKVAQRLVINQSYEAEAMPKILEILSLVRGFSTLEETLGMLAIARRDLINDYVNVVSTLASDLHNLVKENSNKFMVSEVKVINDATIKLKTSLAEV